MMFEYNKTQAIRILDEAERFIKENLHSLSEDDVWGDMFNAEFLWMRETYLRLLTIWPGRKYRREEKEILIQSFKEFIPGVTFSDSLEWDTGLCCSLKQRAWIICDVYSECCEAADHLVMGYTDFLDIGWPCVNEEGIISPEAILILDDLTEYIWKGKRLENLGELMTKESIRRDRNEYLIDVLSYAVEHKEEILADDCLYMMKIPTCQSGSYISGKLLFPIGTLLESWDNCPDFQLDDGSYVISFGGGASGVCVGESVNLQTGDVIGHKGMVKNGNPITWQYLVSVSAPYRTRAKKLFKSGVIPKDINQIKPIPREVKKYRDETYIWRKKRH